MSSIAFPGTRIIHRIYCFLFVSRNLCSRTIHGSLNEDGFTYSEEPLKKMWSSYSSDAAFDENIDSLVHESCVEDRFLVRRSFFQNLRDDAKRVFEVLEKDSPEFDMISALNELQIKVSGLLVREVLVEILKNINHTNKPRSAKVGCRFFGWSSRQENYRHTANSYHLVLKILADCEEYKAMWMLVDEMIERGFPTTARTFNIFICTCGKAGLARKVVERFIKSKSFNYRPFKHSYNAILHSLVVIHHYRLIEWVYGKMLSAGHSPDTLTYNVVLYAKYRLGKKHQFECLLEEMNRSGFSPDLHTYNIFLHILGKANNGPAALELLDHMKEVGLSPSVLHFTTLMDGLSRAGNLDACEYFFILMIKSGCMPDVVCYTVLITGYIVAGELEKAEEIFDEMISRGQLPNVFTYNSMIRGFCMAGKFEKACSMIKEMESRGCNPNFVVYSTLVSNLRNAGRLSEADKIVRHMMDKGKYTHLVSKIKPFRRR